MDLNANVSLSALRNLGQAGLNISRVASINSQSEPAGWANLLNNNSMIERVDSQNNSGSGDQNSGESANQGSSGDSSDDQARSLMVHQTNPLLHQINSQNSERVTLLQNQINPQGMSAQTHQRISINR